MQRRLAWIAVAILTATLAPLLLPATSSAAVPATAVRAKALRLQAQIDALNTQMEVVVERYDAGRMRLADDGVQIAVADRELALARYDLALARRELALQVVAMYKRRPVQFLDVVLATRSFSELVSQVEMLGKVNQQGAELVAGIDQERAIIRQRQNQLMEDRQQARQLVSQAGREKRAISASLAQRRATLGHAQAKVKRLVAQMQSRRQLVATRAADAAQATMARTKRASPTATPVPRASGLPQPPASPAPRRTVAPHRPTPTPKARPTPRPTPKARPTSKPRPRPMPSPHPAPPQPGAAAAVTIARRYLGVPYVWAGASPSGFDCSGLVMYVFARLGISLPHNAAMQFARCTPVPRRSLVAGDLVFFGSSPASIHHVGIYVGNGTMIDAPYTGVDVRYDSLSNDFYSGGRV
jgi:peptidoglycan DL-endopeptidase CwlO